MEMRGPMEAGGLANEKPDSHFLFERYTEAARSALSYARLEAIERQAGATSIADLLAGLSVAENTRAQRIGSLKANGFYLRWLSGLPSLPSPTQGSNQFDAENHPGFDLEAKRALAFAVLEADRDRDYWIDTDHLLRGLLRFPNKAHFALLKTEVNLAAARVASRHDREEFPPVETPSTKVIRYLVRKHFALWVPAILSLACYLYILIQNLGMGLSPVAR